MSNDNNNDNNKIRRKKVSSSTSNNNSTGSRRSSNSKKKDKFKFLRVTGVVILVLLVVCAAGGTGLVFASLRDVQPVTKALLDEKTYQTTKIKYANGKLLSNAPSINKKEPVALEDISRDLQNAVIAIEDERFYEHNGVDIKGLFRSVVKTLMGKKQGGSTIPMQVSKMLLTTSQQTIPRKIKDIYYAYEMSKNVSKEDILEAYLNNFFVGRGLAGAEAGAMGYFSKTAHELSLAESALLAGSTKNPSRYKAYDNVKLDGNETKEDVENKLSFYINTADDDFDDPTEVEINKVKQLNEWGLIPDNDTYEQLKNGTMVVRKAVNNPKAKERQEVVLGKMLELGFITQAQYNEAKAEEIKIKLPQKQDSVSSAVEDLIEYNVIDALMEQGNTKDEAYNMFYNGGLEIMSTIDPSMQNILEKEYDNNNNFPNSVIGSDGVIQPQSSMVILDYRDGQIKALVGGRHITGRKALNRATTPRQPGSTIKPLSVYTPAIDTLKITQADAVSDSRGKTAYKFERNNNWDPKTTTAGSGMMSLRKALAKSSNTIAIKTAEMLGDSYEDCVDVMIDYLRNFGITTLKDSKVGKQGESDRYFPALTLGGMSVGISPLEMAAAYGTLANGGVYVEPVIFTTISTYDGQLIVKNTPEENRVLDPGVAYVLTDMMSAVITEGTGSGARLSSGMPVAGKTGTTNSNLDAWFVGYTPYYVGATYIGDDARKDPETGKGIPRNKVSGTSGTAARLWAKVMGQIHSNLTVTKFKVPDNVYFKNLSGSNAAFVNGTAPSRFSVPDPEPSEEKVEEEVIPEEPVTPETPPAEGDGTTTTPPPTTETPPTTEAPPAVTPTPPETPTPPAVTPTPETPAPQTNAPAQ